MHTTRGAGGQLIICEEFAHMSPKFFFNVVAPTLVTEGVAFIGITTLGEDVKGKDDVNRLFGKTTKSGRSIFRTIIIDDVCDDCKAKGTIGTCHHKQGRRPWWQDPRRQHMLEDMMSKDHFDIFMRENKSEIFSWSLR